MVGPVLLMDGPGQTDIVHFGQSWSVRQKTITYKVKTITYMVKTITYMVETITYMVKNDHL